MSVATLKDSEDAERTIGFGRLRAAQRDKHIRMHVGDDKAVNETAVGGFHAGVHSGFDTGRFTADEDHVFAGAD